jgi:hypothetical protein
LINELNFEYIYNIKNNQYIEEKVEDEEDEIEINNEK